MALTEARKAQISAIIAQWSPGQCATNLISYFPNLEEFRYAACVCARDKKFAMADSAMMDCNTRHGFSFPVKSSTTQPLPRGTAVSTVNFAPVIPTPKNTPNASNGAKSNNIVPLSIAAFVLFKIFT